MNYSTIKATPYRSKRAFLLRRYVNGELISKYRTPSMTKQEFEDCYYNTQGDWEDFLRTNEVIVLK